MSSSIIVDLIGNDLISGVWNKITDTVENVSSDVLKMAGNFEQAQIAFTTMTDNNSTAANDLLEKLQTLANYSPFNFPEETSAARVLLGMGQAADKVLPELKDINAAVSAIGGGNDAVNTVTAAISKMDAEGKTSAIFLNELTRDGIPAWKMMADEMGMSVQQIRELAKQGQITSEVFDNAFHDYVVKNYNSALYNQSQSFQGLISTAQDLAGQFERTFGAPIIQALEPVLKRITAAMADPEVLATIKEWGVEAGEFLGKLMDAAFVIAGMAGINIPSLAEISKDSGAAALNSAAFNTSWATAVPPLADTAAIVKNMRDSIADMRDNQAGADERFEAGIAPLQAQVRALDEAYQIAQAQKTLADAEEQLSDDKVLAVNRFSAVGVAARKAEEQDNIRIANAKGALSHDTAKNTLQDQIDLLNAQKKASDQLAADTERTAEAAIRKLENPIKPTVDPKPINDTVALVADNNRLMLQRSFSSAFNDDAPAAATTAKPKILGALFGSDADWQSVGTHIGNAIGSAISMVDWVGLGEGIGGGLLTGIGDILIGAGSSGSPGSPSYPGTTAGVPQKNNGEPTGLAALGQAFVDIAKGDLGAAAKDWGNWTGILPTIRNVLGQQGSNQQSYTHDSGNYTANPFDLSSYNPIDSIGKAIGSKTGAQMHQPSNEAPILSADGNYYVYPDGSRVPINYMGQGSGAQSRPSAISGNRAGASFGGNNFSIVVNVNGPASQADWNLVGAQISEAVTHHLDGGR